MIICLLYKNFAGRLYKNICIVCLITSSDRLTGDMILLDPSFINDVYLRSKQISQNCVRFITFTVLVNFVCFFSFSAYYAVYECTQAHASRCGGLGRMKFPLRQIYQGLEQHCRTYKSTCLIHVKHPPPPHRSGVYPPGFSKTPAYGGSSSGKKVKARPLGPAAGSPTLATTPAISHSGIAVASVMLSFVQLILFKFCR